MHALPCAVPEPMHALPCAVREPGRMSQRGQARAGAGVDTLLGCSGVCWAQRHAVGCHWEWRSSLNNIYDCGRDPYEPSIRQTSASTDPEGRFDLPHRTDDHTAHAGMNWAEGAEPGRKRESGEAGGGGEWASADRHACPQWALRCEAGWERERMLQPALQLQGPLQPALGGFVTGTYRIPTLLYLAFESWGSQVGAHMSTRPHVQ
eukprot:350131-Chlamydomonas_euryale.AAC.3